MEKFHSMLNKFGLTRGASSDDEGKRSAQSTPRLGRSLRVAPRDASTHRPTRPHYGSLGSMEGLRVNQQAATATGRELAGREPAGRELAGGSRRHTSLDRAPAPLLNHSWDLDRVPGLDRAWEMERTRGLELVHRSMEREKERRTKLQGGPQEKDKKHKKKKKKRDHSKEKCQQQASQHQQLQQQLEQIDSNKLSQERLERRVDELNRMLLLEKHQNRKDKLAVAKLQQEIARQKSERSQVRMTFEDRKNDHRRESLLKELERERTLRIDAEQRLCEMTREKEHANERLQAIAEEYKTMEEMAKSLTQYKGKLEQLREEKASISVSYENTVQKYRSHLGNLEEENSLLLAELKKIESQCSNCHLCNKDLHYRVSKPEPQELGANEHVKVLLERLKKVEEEKSQLVLENETQRQQYEKCLDDIANQVVQALLSQKTLREECGKLRKRVQDLEEQNRQLNHIFHTRIKFASDSVLQGAVGRRGLPGLGSSLNSLNAQAYVVPGDGVFREGENSATPFSEFSLDSLHSMCSDYAHGGQLDEEEDSSRDLGKAAPSTPPPWVRLSPSSSSSGSSGHKLPPPTLVDEASHMIQHVEQLRHRFLAGSKIETEFPATNDSPKMKHVALRVRFGGQGQQQVKGQGHQNGGGEGFASSNSQSELANNLRLPRVNLDTSPGQELLNLRDSFHERYALMEDGVPRIQNNLFSESDTDSDTGDLKSRNMSGSNISLNDLLERGLEDMSSPADDTFSVDNFRIDSEDDRDEKRAEKCCNIVAASRDHHHHHQGNFSCHNNNIERQESETKCSASQTSPELESCCECGVLDGVQGGKEETVQRPTSLELTTDYANCYSSEEEDEKKAAADERIPSHPPFRLRHSVLTDSKTSLMASEPEIVKVSVTSEEEEGEEKKKPPQRDRTQDSGIMMEQQQQALKGDIVIETDYSNHAGGHVDSASPDSAMQQSFSSTSSNASDTAMVVAPPSDHKLAKDDGYSSNSTPSVTSAEAGETKAVLLISRHQSTLSVNDETLKLSESITTKTFPPTFAKSPHYPQVPYVNPAARVSPPGHYQPLYAFARSPNSFNSHSDTCVYRPYFFRRPHYHRMCSSTTAAAATATTNKPQTSKLFRTLSDSALHRHRFRYTDRIVRNIYESLRAIGRRIKQNCGKRVDHPQCKLPTRHAAKSSKVEVGGSGDGHLGNGTVGYVVIEALQNSMSRTCGEGSEFGYKSRDDMCPDGKSSAAEIVVESSRQHAMVLWSSDDDQAPPTSPPPPRLPPRSPRLNIRKYISPTQTPPTTPPKKKSPPTQSPPSPKTPPTKQRAPRTTPISPPKRSPPTSPPKKKVLTNGSIPIKPVSCFVSTAESTPSPDDPQSAIEESVRLLNTVGLTNGMEELENQYKHMQQNHFQGKRYIKGARKSEPDDPGYFDDARNVLSDGEENGDFTQQIENLSKTVTDLQKSLSSLNDLDLDDDLEVECPPKSRSSSASGSPRQTRRYPRRQKRRTPPTSVCQLPADAYSDSSCSDSDDDDKAEGTPGDVDRHGGNFLDSLVMLSSSSDEESGFVYMSASQHSRSSDSERMPLKVTDSPTSASASAQFSSFHNDLIISPGQSDDEESGQGQVRGQQQQRDMMINFLRLHPPKNPRVSQLREECRTDPGPNSARSSQFSSSSSSSSSHGEVHGVGGGFMSFSSSSPSISTTSEHL